MSESITKKKDEKPKEENPESIYRIRPFYEMHFNRDDGSYDYEVHLAGVPKENVELKVLPEFFVLRAKRTEGKSVGIYTLTRYFLNEIDPETVKAEFNDGLLKFSVNIKDPLKDAYTIKL
ncbi:MAG: Hsp20 family protein [Candidatus Lokiarchaeota archaeon]|nr:Hsp20 family protein [Candidatus Lokiarchaeota archaeon]